MPTSPAPLGHQNHPKEDTPMELFNLAVALSALLCTLVAGFVFAFAVVVMPGVQGLGDRDFLRAFQVMDGVIQRNQPLFILVWVGSVLVLLIAAVLSFWWLAGVERLLLLLAAALYLFGVQVPTAVVNVPLNNRLQAQDLGALSEMQLREARTVFEGRWLRWNTIRTVLAILTSGLLLGLLLRL
jgi:uncharacterized membrane protein